MDVAHGEFCDLNHYSQNQFEQLAEIVLVYVKLVKSTDYKSSVNGALDSHQTHCYQLNSKPLRKTSFTSILKECYLRTASKVIARLLDACCVFNSHF